MKCPESVLRWEGQVKAATAGFDIEVSLLLAMIWQESGGNPWAQRFEPAWRYFYNPQTEKPLYDEQISVEANRKRAFDLLGSTEFFSQSMSWGLLQVMGSVARQYQFRTWLSRLCEPQANLMVGVKHLWTFCFQRKPADVASALKRWNGEDSYVVAVLEKQREI